MRKVSIYNPSGNITAFVEGIVRSSNDRKIINDLIMSNNPDVEQVAFYDLAKKQIQMAGGEFCGNALRAFAKILNEKFKENQFKVNFIGIKKNLICGFESNEYFAEFPIPKKVSENIIKSKEESIVRLFGIDVLVSTSKDTSLENAKNLYKKYSFSLNQNATAIVFIKEIKSTISITPIVYVRNINTWIREQACGSGTVGVVLNKGLDKKTKVIQPSGEAIAVKITKKMAEISGKVKYLRNFSINE